MISKSKINVAIVGTVGIPASYGGFETLAENLVRVNAETNGPINFSVYCSGRSERDSFMGASLRYINVSANGISSLLYDALSLISSVCRKDDCVLLLGVSGALLIPVIKKISNISVATNIDGLEWKRSKWGKLAQWFLKRLEKVAVKYSDFVIADNQGIADYVVAEYGIEPEVIAYGGDHAVLVQSKRPNHSVPKRYALALCRIEPENNVELILEAFSGSVELELVFVGNWDSSRFGRTLRGRFANCKNIHMLDPVYDLGILKGIRSDAAVYIHGHSAGGTNPSLVEMMHFGCPIYAFECSYNKFTTESKALFFRSKEDLIELMRSYFKCQDTSLGPQLKKIAEAKYTWEVVSGAYSDLFTKIGR